MERRGHRVGAALLAGLLVVPPAPAQEAGDAPAALVLDTLVVEGGGSLAAGDFGPVDGFVASESAAGSKTGTPLIATPQSVSVVTVDQMQAQGVSQIGDVLRYTAGATTEPYGPDARGIFFQLRGFNVADEAFFRDGLLLRGSDFASFMSLDPYGAERYEVVRGPSSVLYGQISPAGLINYVSKRPTAAPFREAVVEAGSYDQFGGAFDLGGPANADGSLAFRLTGLARSNDTQVDFVSQERLFLAPALTWQPDIDTTLTVLANVQYDLTGWTNQFLPPAGTALPNPNGEIPRRRFTGEPGFDKYEQTQASLGYLYERQLDETYTLRQNARFAYLTNTQEGVFGLGLQPDMRTFDRYGDSGESRMDSLVIDTQLEAGLVTGAFDHTVLGGIDVANNNYRDIGKEYTVDPIDIFDPVYGSPIDLIGTYADTEITLSQVGLYLQDQIRRGGLTLVVGGRQDWASVLTEDRLSGVTTRQDDSAFSGRLGAIYEFGNGVAPYASFATSFMPTIGTDAAGDPFEPETGQQYEVGLKYQPVGWNGFVTLSAFDLRQQNVLTTDPADERFLVQSGEVRSRGIELEATASLADGFDLIASYAYIDAEIVESNDGYQGNRPYGVPENRASLWADYTVQAGRFAGVGGGLGLRYVGETYGDDANSFEVASSTVVDAGLRYQRGSIDLALNASNLLDTRYVASCYTAGAGCFFGEAREIVASLTYRW